MPEDDQKLQPGEHDVLRLTFGQVESRLARIHDIASDKRTQFQARLRNFQRLRAHPIPQGVKAGRGKTVLYRPGHVVEIALALEFTQLGLLPERVEDVFRFNRLAISMAVQIAARELVEKGGFRPNRERGDENLTCYHGGFGREGTEETDPLSMFLYFDPSALAHLMPGAGHDEDTASATFFYGGAGIVRENIVKWTAGPHVRRLSLINVTAMLWSLIERSPPERRKLFLEDVLQWADDLAEAHLVETLKDASDEPKVVAIETYEDVVANADLIRRLKGIPPMVAEVMIKRAQQMIDGKRGGEVAEVPPELEPIELSPDMTPVEFENAMVGAMKRGGVPEFVSRTLLETGRPDRAAKMPETADKQIKAEDQDGDRD